MIAGTEVTEEKTTDEVKAEKKEWIIDRYEKIDISNSFDNLEIARKFLVKLENEKSELNSKITSLKKIAEGHSEQFFMQVRELHNIKGNLTVTESNHKKIVIGELKSEGCDDPNCPACKGGKPSLRDVFKLIMEDPFNDRLKH